MGFKMSSSALKHKPWAKEHKERAAHPNTAEAHNASPLKNANFRYQDVRESSPVKFEKKPTGPRAEKKEESIKDYNTRARMHNTMEIKDRATNPSEYFKVGKDGMMTIRGRMPKPQMAVIPDFGKLKPLKSPTKLKKSAKVKKKTNTVGTGFMNPPYKDTVKGTRPYAKRQGYHGYKNFKSNIKK